MYRSSSPGLAGKKWQKTSSMSSKMIVVLPVPPAPIKRHACCVRFRKGFCFSSSRTTSVASANHLPAHNCSGANLNPVEECRRYFKRSDLLPSHRFRWPAKGSPFCFWTLGIALCSLLHCGNTDLTGSHRIAVEVRHATLISQDRPWGPARNTDLPGSPLRSGTQHWSHRIAVEVRRATLISPDRGGGPARNTDLTRSRLRSGTQHWSHRIAVEVRHATLISPDRGWGPARNTDLTRSRLRSGAQHWSHRIAVEVRHATLVSPDRGWGGEAEDEKEDEDEEEENGKLT